MYVEIKASEGERNTRGKRTSVNSNNFELSVSTSHPEHPNSPDWHIEIRARDERQISSGERSGDFRYIIYDLEIDLGPKDLAKIVQFALSNGLISLRASPAKKIS